jgi:lysozyme family protein
VSSEAFDKAIGFVLPHEEEFARGHWGDENYVVTENFPGDSGGLTKYGIDQAGNPGVDIANLTKEQAIAIYRRRYWDAHNLDALPDKLAICAFDVWVNGGHANLWLQHAYNAAPSRGNAPLLVEDGVLGPVSLAALASGSQAEIVHIFLQQRDARFRNLAADSSRAKFLAGWLERDRDLEALLLAT